MNLTLKQIDDFAKKAAFIADNSTCGYKVGCCGVVISPEFFDKTSLKDPNIKIKNGLLYIKTWNETLPGEIYCQSKDENGCKICIRQQQNLRGKEFEKVCSIHAEQNLISTCAKFQIPTKGMHLFLTNSPCYICAKSIVQSGIEAVYYLAEHTDVSGLQILKSNNLILSKISFG